METDKRQMLHQAGYGENTEENYKPNTVPAFQRWKSLFFSAVLLTYGIYGVWINDLYVPGKRSNGTHLQDLPAWVMFGAIFSACLVMISTCIDHYDKRNNEIKYQRFASTSERVAWLFFAMSFTMHIAHFGGSLKDFAALALVSFVMWWLILWIYRLIEKRARQNKLKIDNWKESERNELANSGLDEFAFVGKDARTIRYSEKHLYNGEWVRGLEIERTLRNDAGDYFYWTWRSDSPHFLKRITQVNAKVILGKDYLEP
jgi:hypothetical protein